MHHRPQKLTEKGFHEKKKKSNKEKNFEASSSLAMKNLRAGDHYFYAGWAAPYSRMLALAT